MTVSRSAIISALAVIAGAACAQSPSAAERGSIIEAVRNYALSYVAALPNYTCTQTTQRTLLWVTFAARPVSNDTLEEQVSVVDHREVRKPIKVNDSAVDAAHAGASGATSRGEFAKLIEVIFDPQSKSVLTWERAGKHDGRPVNILAFHVPKNPHGYLLEGSNGTVQVPYQGLIYADAETNAVLRLEMKCLDIPAKADYDAMSLTVDYKPVPVAGQNYVLPSHYILNYRTGQVQGANEAEFKNYRKFSADSKITFDENP